MLGELPWIILKNSHIYKLYRYLKYLSNDNFGSFILIKVFK